MKKLQAGTPPDSPQNNLGTYTLQAGDTLEQIALQVYGDSSLWYLIADANGITERSAQAGEQGGQMHVGQQIHLPATSLTHNSHATHKVFTRNDWEGDTSASAPLAPPPRQHNLLFKRIVIGVVMTVATVATAGIFGMLSGAVAGFSGLSGILGAGLSLLSGGAALAPSLAFGFTAGFVGSIASQLTAMAFKMQEGIDYKGAAISGLSTAATASLGGVLGKTKWVKALDEKLPLKELFSVKDAVNMMERDALNQSINMAIRHHQCFNWTELAAQGITAGILGGTFGKAVNDGLKSLEPTGILAAEANALATGGADSLAGGNHFDAGKILANNLGNAVGNTVVDVGAGGWKSTLEWFEHHKLMRKQEQEMQQKFNELSLNTKVPEFERFQAEIAAEAYGMEKDKSVEASKTTSAAKDKAVKTDTDQLVTAEQLKQMFPRSKVLDDYLPEFNAQLGAAGINTPKRLAYFFATINVETSGMTRFIENDFTYKDPQYAKDTFGTLKNMPLEEIRSLGNGTLFANTVYAGVNGNDGDVKVGDGYKYRGRGLFHHTGKGNYRQLGGKDYIDNPDLILIPSNDIKAAMEFWTLKKLNKKADLLKVHINIPPPKNEKMFDSNFRLAVAGVNGRDNGIYERAKSYNKYIKMFN